MAILHLCITWIISGATDTYHSGCCCPAFFFCLVRLIQKSFKTGPNTLWIFKPDFICGYTHRIPCLNSICFWCCIQNGWTALRVVWFDFDHTKFPVRQHWRFFSFELDLFRTYCHIDLIFRKMLLEWKVCWLTALSFPGFFQKWLENVQKSAVAEKLRPVLIDRAGNLLGLGKPNDGFQALKSANSEKM